MKWYRSSHGRTEPGFLFDPSQARKISLGDRHYILNEKNYLKDFGGWDEQIRDWLATTEKIELGPEHLGVIAC